MVHTRKGSNSKLLVPNFTYADNVGGAGEPDALYRCALPVNGYPKGAAGDRYGYILAADQSFHGQSQDGGAGAGAAGVSEILYTALEGQLRYLVRPGNIVKVYIGSFGEGGVPPETAASSIVLPARPG